MDTVKPSSESVAEQRDETSAPYDIPPLIILVGSSATDKSKLDKLLSFGAVILIASRSEQVRSWLASAMFQEAPSETTKYDESVIHIDQLTIYTREHRAFWLGRRVPLSERELAILKLLSDEPRRAWSFRELQENVWLSAYFGDNSLVKVAIRRLRSKLRDAGAAVEIESVRGFGFRLASR